MYKIKSNYEIMYEEIIKQLRKKLDSPLGDYGGGSGSYLSKQTPQQNSYLID